MIAGAGAAELDVSETASVSAPPPAPAALPSFLIGSLAPSTNELGGLW